MIRIKNNDKRRSIYTETSHEKPSNSLKRNPFVKKDGNFSRMDRLDEFNLKERKTLSDEKKLNEWKKLGFDLRSVSRKIKNSSVSPSQNKKN